jgi:hypothetical protein
MRAGRHACSSQCWRLLLPVKAGGPWTGINRHAWVAQAEPEVRRYNKAEQERANAALRKQEGARHGLADRKDSAALELLAKREERAKLSEKQRKKEATQAHAQVELLCSVVQP